MESTASEGHGLSRIEAQEQVPSSSRDSGGRSGDQSRDVGVVSKDFVVAMETEGSKSKPMTSKWKGDSKE